MDNLRNLKYVELPMVVLLDEDISSTSKVLMGLITTLTMQDGFCYASNKRLGNLMKVSKRTITSCITSLRRKNYIRVEQEPNERKIYLADIF
ncbi:MAG: helix-turn-helix domain-containing protein [Bacilli bacterium]|nr:helix-turn-helix domain-containing protein [Bacilli bacterium]